MKVPPDRSVSRITLKSIFQSVLKEFNLERGILGTLYELFVRPKMAVREYLFESRQRLTRPFPLLFLLVAIAVFLTFKFLPVGDELRARVAEDMANGSLPENLHPVIFFIVDAFQQYFNLMYMSAIPIAALGTYLVFRQSQLNYAEHLVINTYIFSVQTLFYIFLIPFLNQDEWVAAISTGLNLIYLIYALGEIFELRFWQRIGYTLLVFLFTQTVHALIVGLIIAIFYFAPQIMSL
ncbi:MAG: DUF3667 domain-containing protein [Saprospiraceae bacterium]|nr:DUF3667 domain-containing protein [Saprospiraceae bacterium]